eukprot:scaffold8.g1511.t1
MDFPLLLCNDIFLHPDTLLSISTISKVFLLRKEDLKGLKAQRRGGEHGPAEDFYVAYDVAGRALEVHGQGNLERARVTIHELRAKLRDDTHALSRFTATGHTAG